MTIFSSIALTMQTVLNDKANELAQQTGFIKRQRKITGANFVKTLLFGWI
jgi:hypothetical protein